MSNSSTSITLSPSTENIDYTKPLSQQPEPYNLPIIGKEYILIDMEPKIIDLGKFLYYNIMLNTDNATTIQNDYKLNMLFEYDRVVTASFVFDNFVPKITNFLNKAKEGNPRLSFLANIYFSEKKKSSNLLIINPVYDAKIKILKTQGRVGSFIGYDVNGGGLSRKTNRKNKKNSKSKKTKSNRNKK